MMNRHRYVSRGQKQSNYKRDKTKSPQEGAYQPAMYIVFWGLKQIKLKLLSNCSVRLSLGPYTIDSCSEESMARPN